MQRRTFLAAGAALLSSCSSFPDRKPENASDTNRLSKPNIVLIMADDLGCGHLGCYGQQIIRTPNIDRLSAEGLRFTNAYAGCCVCAPSRSALMTGQHTGHTPLRTNGGGAPLPSSSLTIAKVLKQAGYATGIFGKWGLGAPGTDGMPTRHGFDEFLGPMHQIHAQYYYPDHLWKNEERYSLEGNADGKQSQYAPDVMHSASLDFIRRHREHPFFLYLPSIIPHHEYQSPDSTLGPYQGRFSETPFVREDRGFAPQPRPAEHFAGMVARLDEQVGEIMQALRSSGVDGHTIVIFTSDNGPVGDVPAVTNTFGGAGALRGFKSDLYEGGIRVPFIAHNATLIPRGEISETPCASWDLLPTFADIAGATLPEGTQIDGLSLKPHIYRQVDATEKPQEREFFYWESGNSNRLKQAVRMKNWKAVRLSPGARLELYDLESDPGEKHDVATANPAVLAKIEAYLRTCRFDPPALPESGWSPVV